MGDLPPATSQSLFELVAPAPLYDHRAPPLRDRSSDGVKVGANLDLPREVALFEHAGADLVCLRPNHQQSITFAQRQGAAQATVMRGRLGAQLLHAAEDIQP